MADDDTIRKIISAPVEVAETDRLYRLTPVTRELLEAGRQVAIVPAETEDDARAAATMPDPLGRNWRDVRSFDAQSMETPDRHVVGDVIFRSTPSPNKRGRN